MNVQPDFDRGFCLYKLPAKGIKKIFLRGEQVKILPASSQEVCFRVWATLLAADQWRVSVDGGCIIVQRPQLLAGVDLREMRPALQLVLPTDSEIQVIS